MADHIQIGDISPRIQYTADGVQTVFTYPFAIFTEADMEVYQDTAPKTLGGDFTVAGAGNSAGGAVTLLTAPASGALITLRRRMTVARTSDFQESGEFRAKVINDELDILTALLQQLDEQSARALHIAPTDGATGTELPGKDSRPGKFLAFDALGEPIVSPGPLGGLAVSAFIATLLDNADATTARANLGLTIGTDVLAPTGDGSQLSGIKTGATAAEKANIMLNAFRIEVNSGLAAQSMVDGVVDVFTDQTGVDTVASANQTYDAAGNFYTNAPVDRTTGGTASASSFYAAGNEATSAFDKTLDTEWASASNANEWLEYAFVAPVTPVKYTLFAPSAAGAFNAAQIPNSWTFEGQIGAGAWVVLDTQTAQAGWVASEARTFTFSNATAYDNVRLNISTNNGDAIAITAGGLEVFGPPPNMTLQSVAAAALAQPDNVFAVLWHETIDAVALNTDLKAYASRDGGVTWTVGTLTQAAALTGNQQVLSAAVDISTQPAGTAMAWKIETLNNKSQRLHGVAQQWS